MAQQINAVVVELSGEPAKMGADLFCQGMLPALPYITRGMGKAEIARFYAGLVGAIAGSMCADLDQQIAHDILAASAHTAATADLPPEPAKH